MKRKPCIARIICAYAAATAFVFPAGEFVQIKVAQAVEFLSTASTWRLNFDPNSRIVGPVHEQKFGVEEVEVPSDADALVGGGREKTPSAVEQGRGRVFWP